ncbi:FAD-dependent oxidoreductase [Microbacterium sp. BLY]|uniref:FAD-dependent oxidoreductase n=1 Tax=Microbacterium sp. BLY TaxID=2823280 RepID=UPI001B31C218|nr:FAD-dependent oxidoreductase [Microbacterium sp. BLY]MBP3978463.1 FAD-dependent oxidoreductase [Microbacterium sp. BLY]
MDDSAAHTANIVVVGAGVAAQRFVARLLQDPEHQVRITVIGDEARLPYDRSGLARVVGGASASSLDLDRGPFRDDRVRLIDDDRVLRIDRAGRRVRTRSRRWYGYDALVLATGTHAHVPDVPGIAIRGSVALRTMEDAQTLRAFVAVRAAQLPRPLRAVVVGGDAAGVDAACALQDAGVETTLVDTADRLCAGELSVTGAAALRALVESRGIGVRLRTRLTRVDPDEAGTVTAVEFQDGSFARTDLVVTVGARARDELARNAGLPVHAEGGILVDAEGATADPRVLAIGDVAVREASAGHGVERARIAAERAADLLCAKRAAGPGPERWSAAPGGIGITTMRVGTGADTVTVPLTASGRRVYGEAELSADARVVHAVTVIGERSAGWTSRLWQGEADRHAVIRGLLADDGAEDETCSCGREWGAMTVAAVEAHLERRGITTFADASTAGGDSSDCAGCLRRLALALMNRASAGAASRVADRAGESSRVLVREAASSARIEVRVGEGISADLLLVLARLASGLGTPVRIDRGALAFDGFPRAELPGVLAELRAFGVVVPGVDGLHGNPVRGGMSPASAGEGAGAGGRHRAPGGRRGAPAALRRAAEGSA